MPKMKTRKSVAKRIKITGTGKLMHRKPGRGHLLSTKNGRQLRNGRKASLLSKSFERQCRRLLGI
jgi:large subunit ribosomal protein L35